MSCHKRPCLVYGVQLQQIVINCPRIQRVWKSAVCMYDVHCRNSLSASLMHGVALARTELFLLDSISFQIGHRAFSSPDFAAHVAGEIGSAWVPLHLR
jgi:hypothetical protein